MKHCIMIVPFADIPSKFLTPLNVETTVNYTLDMKKFPGLSSRAPPALVIAPQEIKEDITECCKVACWDHPTLPTNRSECAYTSCSVGQPASLIDAQRELFHLLDSYQLECTGTDVSRGNIVTGSAPFPSSARQPENCCRPKSSQGDSSLTPCRFSGRPINTARESRDKSARKFLPYNTGKYKNSCGVVSCQRISANTNRAERNLGSFSCFPHASSVHQSHVNYGGPYVTKSQIACSVNSSVHELKELQYNCHYGYSQRKVEYDINPSTWNLPKLPFYDNCFHTGYTDFTSLQGINNHAYPIQKENILPFPALMVGHA